MSVDLNALKTLRDLSGAGMSDCKKALEECENDIEKAMKYLREKGIANASKKAGREMKEGICGITVAGDVATVIKLSCETDFVVKNEKFQTLAKNILDVLSKNSASDLESAKLVKLSSGVTVADEIAATIGVIGENMSLAGYKQISANGGVIASYIHTGLGDGCFGKIVACVAMKPSTTCDAEKLKQIGNKVCMHIVATNPMFLKIADVSSEFIESEKEIYRKQMEGSGKPANIIEKIIEGKLSKTYQENVLLEQMFVMDPSIKVSEFVTKSGKEAGVDLEVLLFARLSVV